MTYQDRKDIDELMKEVDGIKYIINYDDSTSLATSKDISRLENGVNKAQSTANNANDKSNEALSTANNAEDKSTQASATANKADNKSDDALDLATTTDRKVGDIDVDEEGDVATQLSNQNDIVEFHTQQIGDVDPVEDGAISDQLSDHGDTIGYHTQQIGDVDPVEDAPISAQLGEHTWTIAQHTGQLGNVDPIEDGTVAQQLHTHFQTMSTHSSQIGNVDPTTDGSIATQLGNHDSQIGNVNPSTDGSIATQLSNHDNQIGNVDPSTQGSIATQLGEHGRSIGTHTNQIGNVDPTTDGTIATQLGTHTNQIGNVPSGSTLQGQINTHTGQIGSVPSGSTLQGQINDQSTLIGTPEDTSTDPTLFGKINETDEKVGNVDVSTDGTVAEQLGDHNSSITTHTNQIGNVPSGSTLQGQITTHTNQIGSVNPQTEGSLATQMNNARNKLSIHDYNFSKLIDPSANLIYALVVFNADPFALDLVVQYYEETFGITSEYIYDMSVETYYKKNGQSWSQYTPQSVSDIVGVSDGLPDATLSQESLLFCYVIPYNRYYKLVRKSVSTMFYYEWEECDSVIEFIDRTVLYDAIDDYFAQKSHTHTASDLPSLTVKDTVAGASATVYSDGLYVTVIIDGTNISVNANADKSLGTIASAYRPPSYVIRPANTRTDNPSKISINDSGQIIYHNATSSTSVTIHNMFTYPLKSRFPS